MVPGSLVTELMNVCMKNNYNNIENFVEEITNQAYSVSQLMEQLNHHIIESFELPDTAKSLIFDKLSVGIS